MAAGWLQNQAKWLLNCICFPLLETGGKWWKNLETKPKLQSWKQKIDVANCCLAAEAAGEQASKRRQQLISKAPNSSKHFSSMPPFFLEQHNNRRKRKKFAARFCAICAHLQNLLLLIAAATISSFLSSNFTQLSPQYSLLWTIQLPSSSQPPASQPVSQFKSQFRGWCCYANVLVCVNVTTATNK